DFALELFKWGVKSPEELKLPDYPNFGMWSEAVALLQRLGAVDKKLHLTPYGEKIYRAALHPRLGDMLLRGIELKIGYLACKLAALLSEGGGGRFAEVEVDKILLDFDRGREFERFRRLADNLAARFKIARNDSTDEVGKAAILLAHAFPDFIGLRRSGGHKRYLLSCGRGARIHERSDYGGGKFIVCAELDAGEVEAQVKLAATLDEKDFYQLFETQFSRVGELEISDDFSQVRIDEVVKFGALELERRRAVNFDTTALHQAILSKIRKVGLGVLPLTDKVKSFMRRMNLAHKYFPEEDFLPLSEEFLLENLELWLEAVLPGRPGKNLLGNIDYLGALKNLFSYKTLRRLDELAPEKISFDSELSRSIDYLGERPTLSCHIQDFYGCDMLPKIMEGRVVLLVNMLSPAGRVVQICDDLANFWRGSYKYVRSEMRSRYPKHNWPEEPWRPESRGRLKKKSDK
ncbi:MAG: ATP-dependent helicase C-terminal domain-containing protein, partial [Victivallaceae bacterium]